MADDVDQYSQKALTLAALLSAFLFILKFVTFWISGSLVVLGSAFDSLGDTTISLINRRVNRLAHEEPDSQHPFGHGGFEVVGSLIQGVVLVMLGFNLIMEAVRRIRADGGVELHPEEFTFAASVLIISAIFGAVISVILSKAEKNKRLENTRSLSLGSDKAHYSADFFTNLLAGIGLLFIQKTGLHWIDAGLGALAGVLTIVTGIPILKKCFEDIMHQEVSRETQQSIVDIVFRASPNVLGIHQLRTRQLGPNLFVDFHMKLPAKMPLEDAHEVGDLVMKQVKDSYPRVDLIVHLDPDSEPDHESWSPSYKKPEA